MTGLSPRILCVQTLMHCLQANSYGNLALHAALEQSKLSPQDKRICNILFQGVMERLLLLDACITHYAQRPTEQIDLPVRCILRCGICELLTLHTPESAAVNLWTQTTKSLRKPRAAGFVNGVLRCFLRAGRSIPLPTDAIAADALRYSVPEPLLRQLLHDYSADLVHTFLADSFGEPPLYLRRNPLACDAETFHAAFPANVLTPIPEIPYAYRLTRSGQLTQSEAFAKGYFHIQDLASQLCVLALDPQPGQTVLDVCAAPGGKSFSIAEQMENHGTVLAYDLHPNRVKLITAGAQRLGLTCISAQMGDAAQPSPERPLADCVLCDVPCSGFGVMRRKPEVRYKSLEEIAGLPEIQRRILAASAEAVKPGGVLLYSTCTLSHAENEDVVRGFLASHPDFTPELPWQNHPALASFGCEMTTLFPSMLGSDGFFLAKLRRIGFTSNVAGGM